MPFVKKTLNEKQNWSKTEVWSVESKENKILLPFSKFCNFMLAF